MDKLNNNAEFSELGELFSSTRKKNSLSLHEVSEKLSIRSTILNDIEHGKFAHLKEGDCAAYAKYLGIDFERVKAVRNLQIEIARLKGDGQGYSAVKIAIGMITITLIIVVIMFLFCSSSDEEQKEVLEVQVKPSMEIKEEKPVEQHVITMVTEEISVENEQVEVKEEAAPTVETVVEDEAIVVGDNNVNTVADTPVQIEKPDVSKNQEAPKSGVVIATEENKTSEVKDVAENNKQETVKAEDVAEKVVTMKVTETNAVKNTSQKEKVATKTTTIKDSSVKTTVAKNTNKKNIVSKKNEKTTAVNKVSTVKSTGLKSGQIVNLADEMKQSNKVKQIPNKQQIQIKKPESSIKILTPKEMEIKKKADMVVITEAVTK